MSRPQVFRLPLKRDGTRAETRFRLAAKRTSPFKSAGASFQSTTGNRGVLISCSNVGYTMFRGSVKGTGYRLHQPVSPSLSLPCVTVCHHVSTGLYTLFGLRTRHFPYTWLGRSAMYRLGQICFHVILWTTVLDSLICHVLMQLKIPRTVQDTRFM